MPAVVGPGDAHDPALRLDHGIVAGESVVGAALPVTGNGAVDETGVVGPQAFAAQTEPLHAPGLEVFHNHVGLRGQLSENRPPGLCLQVKGDAALVAVGAKKVGALAAGGEGRAPMAGVVAAAGLLDLDDLCAEIAECHRGVRASEDARQVENCNV